jgi:hypothetical protein
MGTSKITALFEIAVQADLQMEETMDKGLVKSGAFWIPAFAGMTGGLASSG